MGLYKLPKSGQGPRHENGMIVLCVKILLWGQFHFSGQLIQKFYQARKIQFNRLWS